MYYDLGGSMTRQQKLEMEKTLTRAKFPYLIEITYTDKNNVTTVYRYANSDDDKIFEGNTFSAGYFSMQLPQKNQSGFTDAKISISAIDHTWIERIRNASQKKRSKIRFVATIEYGTIEAIEDMEFTLTNATSDGTVIQWNMKFDELSEIKVPYDICDDRICPALV